MGYSPWFLAKIQFFVTLSKKDIVGKSISRGAEWHNFFVAPSSEELLERKELALLKSTSVVKVAASTSWTHLWLQSLSRLHKLCSPVSSTSKTLHKFSGGPRTNAKSETPVKENILIRVSKTMWYIQTWHYGHSASLSGCKRGCC